MVVSEVIGVPPNLPFQYISIQFSLINQLFWIPPWLWTAPCSWDDHNPLGELLFTNQDNQDFMEWRPGERGEIRTFPDGLFNIPIVRIWMMTGVPPDSGNHHMDGNSWRSPGLDPFESQQKKTGNETWPEAPPWTIFPWNLDLWFIDDWWFPRKLKAPLIVDVPIVSHEFVILSNIRYSYEDLHFVGSLPIAIVGGDRGGICC